MPHVIFLAPHFPAVQRRFVKGLKAVGARVTGIGDSPIERLDSELCGMLDGYEYVNSVTNEEAVYQAVRKIQARGPWVHHFEATIESHVLVAAKVRERTMIPGTPYEVVDRCRDKFVMKNFLRERGVPCARNAEVFDGADARRVAKEMGFPIILKPRDGAGAAGTWKIDDVATLERAIKEEGLDQRRRFCTMEEFISGHEGFYDTLTVNGEVAYEFVSHYYPNVLEGMRDRSHHPMIVTTNRIDAPGYDELKQFGRKVVKEMGLVTSASHMEWFYGQNGLKFSEIGARPPGVNFWDIYAAANEVDIFAEWGRSICYGDVHTRLSRRFSAGLVNIRPDRDGTVVGHSGVEEVHRKYGQYIFRFHMPAIGQGTQPIEAGFLANGYCFVKHPDYDVCRGILDDIGSTLKIHAR